MTTIPLGRYLLTPLGTPDKTGATRWRMTGPGGPFSFRMLTPDRVALAAHAFLEAAGVEAGPYALPPSALPPLPPRPPKQNGPLPLPPIGPDDPLPEWATVKADPIPGVCVLVGCGNAVDTRDLCRSHDSSARRRDIRDRLGPPPMSRQEASAMGCRASALGRAS